VKLREPFTYFVDRSLGRKVLVTHLRAHGLQVEAHDDHFAADTTDAEWLGAVGRRGWVVLTKDKAIRRNTLEREALLEANVACFMLGRGASQPTKWRVRFSVPFHDFIECCAGSTSHLRRASRQRAMSPC